MSDNFFKGIQKDMDKMRLKHEILSSVPSLGDVNELKIKIIKLEKKVDNLILLNGRLMDIINNPDWENVKDNIEAEKDDK